MPLNRLLNQPTIHLSWLKQNNGEIEFLIGRELFDKFERLWNIYVNTGIQDEVDFLNSTVVDDQCLYDDDHLFSLFAGASYIQKKYPSFEIDFSQEFLFWRIDV